MDMVNYFTTGTILELDESPVDGLYPELAKLVRQALKWDRSASESMSTRVAARKTGISHATIANMARGDRPSRRLVHDFGIGMNVDVNALLKAAYYPPLNERSEADPLSRIGPYINMEHLDRIPVSRRIASVGDFRGPGDIEQEEEAASSRIPSQARGIEVRGDCMEPFFHNADVVFIRPQEEAESGQKVVALLNDDSLTCKVFSLDGNGGHLEATNGKYPRINAPDFKILGVVVKVLKDVF